MGTIEKLEGNPFASTSSGLPTKNHKPQNEDMASDATKSSWPELVGMNAEEAKQQLENELADGTLISIVPEGSTKIDFIPCSLAR